MRLILLTVLLLPVTLFSQFKKEYHVLGKVSKEELSYEHYLNAQQINGISVNTYNPDAAGNIVVSKLDKKLVYHKKSMQWCSKTC